MQLQLIDWIIVFLSIAICFVPALFFGKRSGKSAVGVLCFRPLRAVVAGWAFDGGDYFLQRHA